MLNGSGRGALQLNVMGDALFGRVIAPCRVLLTLGVHSAAAVMQLPAAVADMVDALVGAAAHSMRKHGRRCMGGPARLMDLTAAAGDG